MDIHAYGGEAPQEVLDGDTVAKTHEEIVAEADKLDGSSIPE